MTIVIAGDDLVGKYEILHCFAQMKRIGFPCKSSNAQYNLDWKEDNVTQSYSFWKNNKKDGVTYHGSHLVLVFSVINKSSFDSIRDYWKVKFPGMFKSGAVLLIGNKCDLRSENQDECVTTKMGAELMKQIGAGIYIETSAKTSENIPFIFSILTNNVLGPRTPMSVIPFSDFVKQSDFPGLNGQTETDMDITFNSSLNSSFPFLQACYPNIYSFPSPYYYPSDFSYSFGCYYPYGWTSLIPPGPPDGSIKKEKKKVAKKKNTSAQMIKNLKTNR